NFLSLERGKTTLLFQYATSFALEKRSVFFVCNKRKIQTNPPLFPPAIKPENDLLQFIQMKSLSLCLFLCLSVSLCLSASVCLSLSLLFFVRSVLIEYIGLCIFF